MTRKQMLMMPYEDAKKTPVETRDLEFSVHTPMTNIIKAYPSLVFKKRGSNGGVTYMYDVTGPKAIIERVMKYTYGWGQPQLAWL